METKYVFLVFGVYANPWPEGEKRALLGIRESQEGASQLKESQVDDEVYSEIQIDKWPIKL